MRARFWVLSVDSMPASEYRQYGRKARNMEIRKSKASDKENIVRLADAAFGKMPDKEGFADILPGIYGRSGSCEGNHWLLYEAGEMKALLLAEPKTYRIGDCVLKIAGIGTVSVAPSARGRGYMRALMDKSMRALKDEGYAMAFLGGQRQRYAYWGFEPCGLQACYVFQRSNLKHMRLGTGKENIKLHLFTEKYLKQFYTLWKAQSVKIDRSIENFMPVLSARNGIPYVCLKENIFAGYVVLSLMNGRCRILELVLEPELTAAEVIAAVFGTFDIQLCDIKLPQYRQEILKELEGCCEQEIIGANRKFRIFDWQKVIQAFMDIKATYSSLSEGRLMLCIKEADGTRENIQITVAEGKPLVENVKCPKVKAREIGTIQHDIKTLETTATEAHRHLFAPMMVLDKKWEGVPEDWFPLPLYIEEQDCC